MLLPALLNDRHIACTPAIMTQLPIWPVEVQLIQSIKYAWNTEEMKKRKREKKGVDGLLLDVFVHELLVELGANSVIDEVLLLHTKQQQRHTI